MKCFEVIYPNCNCHNVIKTSCDKILQKDK